MERVPKTEEPLGIPFPLYCRPPLLNGRWYGVEACAVSPQQVFLFPSLLLYRAKKKNRRIFRLILWGRCGAITCRCDDIYGTETHPQSNPFVVIAFIVAFDSIGRGDFGWEGGLYRTRLYANEVVCSCTQIWEESRRRGGGRIIESIKTV